MADMTLLATTENYAALLARVDAKINALAQMFISDVPTNIPAGKTPVRFNTATAIWEQWNGTAWVAMAAKYNIVVDKADSMKDNGGAYRVLTALQTAYAVVMRDVNGKVAGSITGDADTLDGNHSTAFATSAQGGKADAALAASSYTPADILAKLLTVDGIGSGLDADMVDGIQGSSIITTGNIASQSVSSATSAGTANSANNSVLLAGQNDTFYRTTSNFTGGAFRNNSGFALLTSGSGNWSVPVGVDRVWATLWGGGGGGGAAGPLNSPMPGTAGLNTTFGGISATGGTGGAVGSSSSGAGGNGGLGGGVLGVNGLAGGLGGYPLGGDPGAPFSLYNRNYGGGGRGTDSVSGMGGGGGGGGGGLYVNMVSVSPGGVVAYSIGSGGAKGTGGTGVAGMNGSAGGIILIY